MGFARRGGIEQIVVELDGLRIGDNGHGRRRAGGAHRAQPSPVGGAGTRSDPNGPRSHAPDRKPRRNHRLDPAEERGDVGGDPRRRRDHRPVGRPLVDDGEPGRDARPVPGIDGAVDRRRKDDPPTRLQFGKGAGPGRIVRREAGAGDCHQPPTRSEARQRRGDVAEGGVGDTALDVRERRERRVHQHNVGAEARVEVIVDLRCVEARNWRRRKQRREQVAAGVGELVQRDVRAGDLGEDGEKAGAGRGLQHTVGGGHGRGGGSGEAEADRRRELLQGPAFLGAAGLGWQQRRDALQQAKPCGRLMPA